MGSKLVLIASAVTALFVLGLGSAWAEVGASAQPSGAIAGCPSKAQLLSGDLPETASAPCLAVVTLQGGATDAFRANVAARNGAHFRFGLDLINGASVFVPNDAALGALLRDPTVVDIRPDGTKRF